MANLNKLWNKLQAFSLSKIDENGDGTLTLHIFRPYFMIFGKTEKITLTRDDAIKLVDNYKGDSLITRLELRKISSILFKEEIALLDATINALINSRKITNSNNPT